MTKLGSTGANGSLFYNRSRSGGSSRPTVDPAYAQDPQLAEAQRIFRQQSSTAQIGEAYAASRVMSAQEAAQRELDNLLKLKAAGRDISDDRIKELEDIANPDFWQRTQVRALETAAPIFKALELIDRPRQFLTLAANDLLQWDQKDGAEIELGHYGDLILGRKDKLLDELGAEIVGEDGMIGFSTVLDDVGWEKTDSWLNKVGRFSATLAGEILTDPLTYMTFGASTLGKAQRGRHLIKVVNDAVGNVSEAVIKGSDDAIQGMGSLGKRMKDEAVPRAQEIQAQKWAEIDDALESGSGDILGKYGVTDASDAFDENIGAKIWEDSVKQASVEVGDATWNKAAPALVAKDYANPALREIAQGMDSKMLSGGVKLIIPIYSARTGKAAQLVPGGSGRKITNALFGHSSEYAKGGAKAQATGARRWLEEGVASPLYDRWRKTVEGWGDDGLWRNVMRGQAPAASQVMRARDELAKSVADLTDNSGMRDLARHAVTLQQTAKELGMSEEEVRTVMRGVGRIMETRPNATIDEMIGDLQQGVSDAGGNLAAVPEKFATQLQAWSVATRRTLDNLHEAAAEAGVEGLGDKLHNYMPHMLTGEANEMLDNLLALGLEPRGDKIGAQLLRALMEGRRRATTTGETVVGEATGATERTIGRTVASGTGDISVPVILGDTVLHDKSSFGLADLTSEELNKAMREALDDLEGANPNFKRPKQSGDLLDFEIYNENPFVTVQAYSHDMMMAVAESKFVQNLQEIGVVSDAVTYVNKQDLARSVLKNLGRYGNDVVEQQQGVVAKLIDDKMRMIRSIEDGVDVTEDLTPVKVRVEGGTKTVNIPTSALEANKDLARRVAQMNNAANIGEATDAAAQAFYNDTFTALSRQGVAPQEASALAQSATRKEIRDILKEARGTIKTQVREQLQEYNLARATTHEDRLAANEAAYREAVAQFHAQADLADEALGEIDAALGRGGEVATDVPRPIATPAGVTAVNDAMRAANIERIRDVARRARDQGHTDQALQVEAVADYLETAALNFEEVASIESLGNGIGELVQEMNNLSAARTDYLNVHRETYVAQASGMMDQAYYYADGFLDSGSWGDRYVNAQFAFHGTDRPNASQLALTEKFGGGGISPNPVRATRYAGSQWVVVWRMEDLPDGVKGSLRGGQDIESRNQLLTMSGSGAERQQMPQPIAVIPAAAMREASIRSASDPAQLRNIGREAGASTLVDMFGERASALFREGAAVDDYWRLIDRAFDDPTFAGTDEFYESMFELLTNRSEVGLSDNWSVEAFDDFHKQLNSELMDRRAWSREGAVSEYNGKPPDVRGDASRKRVIKTWWDKWGPQARETGSQPMSDFGQPVTAAWIDPYRVVNGNQGANQLYDQLHSKRTPARFDPAVWDEADIDDVGSFSIPHQIVNVEMFFEEEFHMLRSGQMSDQMRDLYEASQVSLAARGLEDEFPVWVVGGAQENYGMAKMSLAPVEDATVYTVRREDVALDWGAMFPNENLTPDAISLRHQIYVDPSKLREAAEDTLELSTATGWIPAASWQNMKPQNLTIERMMATFGDPDVAENAYRDLMERMNLIPNVSPKALQNQAEMTVAAQGWSNVSTRGGTQVGILRGVENIYSDPQNMGTLLEHPDVRRWYATQVKENLGLDVQFTEVTLVPDTSGGYRAGLPGQEGGVQATVPVFTERVMRPALDAADTQVALRDKGWTQSDARMAAARKQEYDSLSVQQFNDLPPERQGQLSAANAAFEGEDALYHTLSGYTDEMGQAMDRATSAAERAARLNGNLDNTTELLLGPPTELAPGVARGRAHQALNQLAEIPLTSSVRSAVSVRTGQNAARGYLITPGTGRTRYALAEGAISEDWIEDVRRDVTDWVSVNHKDLSRPGANIVWRREGDEMVLEIGGTTNSVRTARSKGMDTVDNEVYDLLTGERIAVPDTVARIEKRMAAASKDTEALDLLDGIDRQIKGNHWDIAEGRLVEPKNKSAIVGLIGTYEYGNLLEQVQLERFLKRNVVPDKEARRAASRARRMLGDPVQAREALDGVEAEARAVQTAVLSEEIGDLMEAQVQVSDLFKQILGVGLDESRDLTNLKLYPTFQGAATVEASQMAVDRVREVQALAKELGWDDIEDAMRAVTQDVPYKTMAKPGQQTFSVWGVGGRQMQFKAADASTAQFIEQAVSRWQAITTPEGMDMFAKQLNWVARAWKTMATVARPNFHPRNVVGGTFNNMAIGVTTQNYMNSVAIGRKLNRLRRARATDTEMAEAFGAQWERVEAAINTGIFGEGFAAGDLRIEVPRGKGGVSARDAILNPASGDWIPARMGGAAMENIEGFLRFAAFDRYYDDLGAEGARDMVNMTQFNYANVNQMDAKFKKYIPFWIWTKNNVPLQFRMMLEDPGIVARYTHLMSAVDDNFGGEQDDFPLNQFMSPFAASMGVQLGDDQSWARMVFDPDVPITDLGPFLDNPLSVEYYGAIISNMLGPQFTTPMQIADQNDWGQTNAPLGIAAVLKGLDALGLYDAKVTADGDVQVGYGTKNAFNTAFPILNEYASLGGAPTGPEQQQKLGITDPSDLGQRLRGGAVFGLRGLGVQTQTPNDTRIAAFHAEKRVQDIVRELKLAGQIPPDTPDPVVRQYLAELGITANG